MPLQIPTVQTGLEASIQAAAQKAGKKMKIDLGANSKSIEALSQPLGRITGKADEFTKSMEAANARVLAFGASVGVLSAITRAFKDLVTTTIAVEKSLANINSILNVSAGQLGKFKKEIFDVARNTEQTFDTVAQAALDLSRQGLKAEEVTNRLNDAMILARLSGLGASEAVSGLTAAINSFNREGLTSEQVLNKIAAAAVSAAVSERDLIEGIKRSGSVAIEAGVSFDELVGVISALQQKTARGGSVIGNSLKTIFTRLQSLEKLKTMQELGTEITDAAGAILPATKLIENLATSIRELPDTRKLQIAENLVGKFQIAPFLALLSDYNSKTQTAIEVTRIAAGATNEAYTRNIALSKTLSAAINQATVSLKELANMLGEIGVTDSLKNILGFFNSLVGSIKGLLEGEGLGGDFARGIVKGIGAVISGPGLAIFAAIIAKLTLDLVKFGTGALKTFFGMNRAAKEMAVTQGAIASSLLKNSDIQKQILAIENSTLSVEQKRAAQTQFFTTALNTQLATMKQMQAIAASIAPAVIAAGRAGSARAGRGRAAEGFIPNFDAVRGYGSESADIKRGVGGAPSSARPVTIPNFNFGSGQRGTMVANSSEFVVPNFAAGGSAIFNQEMVKTMGMPSGAKSLAAGGYIPNFAKFFDVGKFKNLRANQVADKLKKKEITQKQAQKAGYLPSATPAYGMGVAGTGIFDFPARSLGIASMFPGKQSDNTQMATSTLTGQAAVHARKDFPGVKEFRFRGLQIRSLDNAKVHIKKKQTNYRRTLERLFLEPLAKLAGEMVGPPPKGAGFAHDELSKITPKTRTARYDPDIFTSSVQGGLFEAAIRLFTKGVSGIPEFKSHSTEQAPFDFEETGLANEHFKKAFGFGGSLRKADAKRSATAEAVRTIIPKALNDVETRTRMKRFFNNRRSKGARGSGKRAPVGGYMGRAADGYIPNFAAAGALEESVAREEAAGVPINQIRINQDASLRNSGNPKGLAVTNMRDEPTGSIHAAGGYVPNFQSRGSFVSSPMGGKDFAASMNKNAQAVDKNTRATGGGTDKMFALMIASSFLAGSFSESKSKFGVVMESFTKGLMNATLALTAMSMLKPTGTGGVAKTGRAAMGLAATLFIVKSGAEVLNQAFGNSTDKLINLDVAAERLAKSSLNAALKLDMLDARGRGGAGQDAKAVTHAALMRGTENRGTLAKTGDFLGDFVRGNWGTDNLQGTNVFEGRDDEQIKAVVAAATAAQGRGGNLMEVRKIIADLAPKNRDAKFTDNDFNAMIDAISNVGADLDLDKIKTTFDPLIESLGGVVRVTQLLDAGPMASGPKPFGFDELPAHERGKFSSDAMGLVGKTADVGRPAGFGFKGAQRALKFYIASLKEAENAEEDLEDKTRKRLATTQALSDVSVAGTELQARLNVVEAAETELAIMKALGTSTAEQIQRQERIVALRNVDKKDLVGTAAALAKVAKLTKEVTADKDQAAKAAETIKNLTFEQVDTEKERGEMATLIAEQMGVTDTTIQSQVKHILEALEASKKLTEADRINLDILRDQNNEIRERGRLAEAEAASSLTRSRAFDKTFTAREGLRRLDLEGAKAEIGADLIGPSERDRRARAAAQRGVDRAQFQRDEGRVNLADSQRGQLKSFISGNQPLNAQRRAQLLGIQTDPDTPFFQKRLREDSLTLSGSKAITPEEIVASFKDSKEIVAALREASKGTPTHLKENLLNFALELENGTKDFDAASLSVLEMAKAARDATDGLGKIKSISVLAEEKARQMKEGVPGATLDMELTSDPFARAKKGIAISNTKEMADLIEKQDFAAVRQLQQANEMRYVMIDGASQFADKLGSAMSQAIRDGGSFGDALKSAGRTFLDYISDAMFKMAAQQMVGGLMGSGGGGILKSLFGGGGMASGGPVTGGSGRRDDVPAMLTGGEFVMRKRAVDQHGVGFMNQLNEGRVQGFANGGAVMNQRDILDPAFSGKAISGKRNLMGFAKQGVTSGSRDFMRGGGGADGAFGAVALQPGSIRGTQFQRRTDRVAQGRTEARTNALNLYFQQLDSEKSRQEQWDAEQQRLLEQRIREEEEARKLKEQERLQREAERKAKKSRIWGYIGGALGFMVGGPMGYAVGSTLGSTASGMATGGRVPHKGGVGHYFGGGMVTSLLGMGIFDGQMSVGKSGLSILSKAGYIDRGPEGGMKGAKWGKAAGKRRGKAFGEGDAAKAWGMMPTKRKKKGGLLGGIIGHMMEQNPDWLEERREKQGRREEILKRYYGERFGGSAILQRGGFGSLRGRVGGRASGGSVPYAAGVDTVPSMLSGGEFVMNAAATQRIGEGNLAALNSGAGGASGGADGLIVEKLQELINVSEGGRGDINITVNSDGTENTKGGGGASQSAMSLAARIRDSVTEILEQEKRLGGTLRTA